MAALAPQEGLAPPPPPWGEETKVRALFESRGARVELSTHSIVFEAASPEAWFADQEANHPVWRFVHRALEASPEKWTDLRDRSVDALRAGNLAPDAFRVASDYMLVKVAVV